MDELKQELINQLEVIKKQLVNTVLEVAFKYEDKTISIPIDIDAEIIMVAARQYIDNKISLLND